MQKHQFYGFVWEPGNVDHPAVSAEEDHGTEQPESGRKKRKHFPSQPFWGVSCPILTLFVSMRRLRIPNVMKRWAFVLLEGLRVHSSCLGSLCL